MKLTFKQFARLKRLEAGLTQQQCANALGTKRRGAFYNLESSKRRARWSLKSFVAFAELLGVKPSELMAEFEEMNEKNNSLN